MVNQTNCEKKYAGENTHDCCENMILAVLGNHVMIPQKGIVRVFLRIILQFRDL